jgi:hypothetical protein
MVPAKTVVTALVLCDEVVDMFPGALMLAKAWLQHHLR